MNLICKINGKVYDKNIAQGLTISEEYNETLDSGAIILTHVSQIVDLKPYDDVWIYEKPEKSIEGQFDYVTVKNEEKNDPKKRKRFYRHFLVDNYSEKILNLEGGIYEYTIELFSETKLLEKIICPSTCVTEPLDIADKHDIEWYLDKYISLYSPEIKRKGLSGNSWVYDKKYKIAESLREKVRGKYPQDFQLTNPTLREILTQLLLTQDLIPIVKDDVIDALDITQRNEAFHNNNIDEIKEYVNSITGSMSSDNYTDSLRKTYTEAISQECLSSNIERIGFRNKDSALLTLSNLQIETRFPIYSIEQALLCYYKRLKLVKSAGIKDEILYQDVLCKQDITPFILLNSARNVLSKDWSELENKPDPTVLPIEEITKFRLYTLGYDIGSNVITGWGEIYSYPKASGYDVTLTYIQNILYYLEKINPFGINLGGVFKELLNTYKDVTFDEFVKKENPFNIIPDIWGKTSEIGWTTDVGTKIKSMFVELKYKGFFKGTVITSKDGGRDYIQTSDNSNSSLTLLEKDGLAQKEKINRFGNKTMVFTARYPGNRYDLVQPLGCVYNYAEDRDIVIYHKEMAFYDNAITCTYYGARDYVLKNFYTSVRAKLRLNRLMGYEESVRRCENEKVEILFSKDKLYYEDGFVYTIIRGSINSALEQKLPIIDSQTLKGYLDDSIINSGIIEYTEANSNIPKRYCTDINKSVNGKSIVFNLAMYDNVSPGVYIKEIKPEFNAGLIDGYKLFQEASSNTNMTVGMYKAVSNYTDLTGSTQEWYLLTDENGESDNITFAIGKFDTHYVPDKSYSPDGSKDAYTEDEKGELNIVTKDNYEKSFKLPLFETEYPPLIYWSKTIQYKDNKEIIDQTFQIEYCTDEKDNVFIGQNYLLLNGLINSKNILSDSLIGSQITGYILSNLYAGVLEKSPSENNVNPFPYFEILLGNTKDVEDLLTNGITNENISIDKMIFGEKAYSFPYGVAEYYTYYKAEGITNPESFFNGERWFNSQKYIQTISIHRIDVEGTIKKVVLYKSDYSGGVVALYIPCRFYYEISLTGENTIYGHYYTDKILRVDLIHEKDIQTGGENFALFKSAIFSTSIDVNIDGNYSPISYDCFDLRNEYIENSGKYNATVEKKFDFSIYNEDGLNTGALFFYLQFNLLDKVIIKEVKTPQTMFVVYSTNPCTKTTEYEQYGTVGEMNGKGYYIKDNLKVSDVFKVENNKIIINKSGLDSSNYDKDLGETIQSIQYWYYDNSTHSYKFVFGINLTDATEESVYFSVVKNKDTRVFDGNGEVVGHIHNFAGDKNPVFAQKFDKIETLQTENNIV